MAASSPARYPARSIAASMSSSGCSFVASPDGAKPPSSPTPVAIPRSCSTSFSAWKISEPIRIASLNVGAPIGTTMNSCMSAESVACLPPFKMFMSGTGNVAAPSVARWR